MTERIWNAPWPKITVRYKNTDVVHFRAIAYDWSVFLEKKHRRPPNLSTEERREVLSRKPVLEWSEKLPATADYKERVQALKAPEGLKPGYYFIAASHDPAFGENNNVVSMADVFVTDLALVTRTRDSRLEGFVLKANSGEPIEGAEIAIWHLNNQGERVASPKLATDKDGFFSLKPDAQNHHGWLVRARHEGQEIASADDLWLYDQGDPNSAQPYATVTYFTDRAIYRPGQMIHYKGICLWIDQAKDNYELLKNEKVTAVFKDVNGKEIARQTHTANDYGSFSGSFTAPRDRVLGHMSIQSEGRAHGQAGFLVEEYKRPKFEVVLERPKTAPRLNDKVTLPGRATAYTGAAIDNANVRYRVIREVRMPWWWGWWRGGGWGGRSQEIAHGTLTTKTDGSFQIEFAAKPDPSIPEKNEPTFRLQCDGRCYGFLG